MYLDQVWVGKTISMSGKPASMSKNPTSTNIGEHCGDYRTSTGHSIFSSFSITFL
jgi:hypothetical protein